MFSSLSPEDVYVQMAHQKVSSSHPHKPQRGKFILPTLLQDASYQLGLSEVDWSYQLTKDYLLSGHFLKNLKFLNCQLSIHNITVYIFYSTLN